MTEDERKARLDELWWQGKSWLEAAERVDRAGGSASTAVSPRFYALADKYYTRALEALEEYERIKEKT